MSVCYSVKTILYSKILDTDSSKGESVLLSRSKFYIHWIGHSYEENGPGLLRERERERERERA